MFNCCEIAQIAEIRNWILLLIGIVGAYITIKNYINSVSQKKLDNTYKTIDFLRRHISDTQINTFIKLFQANNELSGVKYNQFKFQDGREDSIEEMFSEGGCGNGDIHNMIELFNLVSATFHSLDERIIWYEYGQIMSKIYDWTKYLEDKSCEKNNLEEFYSNFNKYMSKNTGKLLDKPMKYYTYAEY